VAAYPLQSRKLKGPIDAEDLKQQCLAFDRLMSFDAKHALQNASIVGGCAGRTTGIQQLLTLAAIAPAR
jgi:hypothetical protein